MSVYCQYHFSSFYTLFILLFHFLIICSCHLFVVYLQCQVTDSLSFTYEILLAVFLMCIVLSDGDTRIILCL